MDLPSEQQKKFLFLLVSEFYTFKILATANSTSTLLNSRTEDGADGEACESLRHGADEDGHAQARGDLQAAGSRALVQTHDFDDAVLNC